MGKTKLELVGTELELVASVLTNERYERWQALGLPDDRETDSDDEELEDFYDLLDANIDSGLIPDEDLQLFVNDAPVLGLHEKINNAQNFTITDKRLVSEASPCLCAASYSKRSVLSLEIDKAFDFNALHWAVTGYSINGKTVGFVLDVSYEGQSFEYQDGNGVNYRDVWLERVET